MVKNDSYWSSMICSFKVNEYFGSPRINRMLMLSLETGNDFA